MFASLNITSTGAVLPLSLADAKKHLRVDHNDDDGSISQMIDAAFDFIERRTGRAFRELAGQLKLQGFPEGGDPIYVPRPTLKTVTSITYKDSNNQNQTLSGSAYQVLTSFVPGRIVPVYGTSWPTALDHPESVVVTFTAGTAICPAGIIHAAKLFIDLEYHEHDANRATRIQDRIDSLIKGHTLRDRNLIGLET